MTRDRGAVGSTATSYNDFGQVGDTCAFVTKWCNWYWPNVAMSC